MRARLATALTVSALLAGCGAHESTPAGAEPAAIASPALGLQLSPLPEGVAASGASGAKLALTARADGIDGVLTIEIVPPRSSAVNLVDEAKAFGEEAAAAPGGRFFGGNQLVTPTGPAYTVRVLVDRGLSEERVVFLLHPDGSGRLVRLTLRYPPGDGEAARARLRQMLDVVEKLSAVG